MWSNVNPDFWLGDLNPFRPFRDAFVVVELELRLARGSVRGSSVFLLLGEELIEER